jgi:hypothetical protein
LGAYPLLGSTFELEFCVDISAEEVGMILKSEAELDIAWCRVLEGIEGYWRWKQECPEEGISWRFKNRDLNFELPRRATESVPRKFHVACAIDTNDCSCRGSKAPNRARGAN